MGEFHVLIVGAGITGLLLAQALKKANIKYTIFESEVSVDAYRARQWGLSIHWSTSLLKKILPENLWSRIQEGWVDPSYDNPDVEYLNIYDASTGKKMSSMKEPHHMRFNRARMRKFCTQGINVQYNKTLLSIERRADGRAVTAVSEDGSSVSGSMIVGADGPNSIVRHLLLGDERAAAQPASTPDNPFTIVNAMIRYPKAEQAEFVRKLHTMFYMGLHPEGGLFMICIQDVPDPKDPTTWVFQLFLTWRGSPPPDREDVLPALKSWIPKLVDPWKSAIEWIPDDTILETQRISYWHPITRDNWDGRITLLGDAAHPMVPYRGQGLSHCIADVTSLLGQIQNHLSGENTLAHVIDVYDAEVVSRAGDEVNVSLQSMNFLTNWEMVEQSPSFKKSADPNEAALKVIHSR